MDNKIDKRIRRDQEDRLDRLSSQDHQLSSFPSQPAHTLHSSRNGPITPRPDGPSSGYSLMVAGQATGKTAFLRLLLDTSEIASTTTQDQLASVAKFVQGCAGHTSHIRTVSFDIDLDPPELGQLQSVSLTLTDTPSLDIRDESASERLLSDILRHVETKFSESLEDEYKARIGDHHIHLCIYFLDPDGIIPPSAIRPPAPLLPRTHTNNVSQSDVEPVILEPPVTTNPLLRRPVLPQAEINVIRALSSRVNVLPVIARADTLTNDRLAAIKMAIRHDLAEAGIGFGIFDLDTHPPSNGDNKAFNGLSNGSSSSPGSSSPTSPVTPSFLRLPYALISPDCYSHSDGVNRPALARHELVLQYTPGRPPSPNALPNKLIRGKFTRSYRWGFLDVLDPNHSDFLPLRQAIYHHMQTLQKYTREYLYDKFRMEYMMQHHPGESRAVQVNGPLPPLSNSRPILNIDSPLLHSGLSRHAAITASRQLPVVDAHVPTINSALSDSGQENNRASTSQSFHRIGNPNRQRAKKITVACNFCRSRKLKCDGGRPACHQCLKRSNACDYMVPQKRRGGMRQRRNLINSDSEGASGDERSVEIEPSASPEAVPKPLARVAPDRELPPLDVIQQQSTFGKHEDMPALKLQQFPQHKSEQVLATSLERRGVPAPEETAMSSLSSGHQAPEVATQRKRVPTVSARGNRSSSNYGPKVVACNHCRARKTKCDGGHPTCSSCARRSLTCNYVNDPNVPGGPRRKGSTTASEPASAASSGPVSAGPSSAASVSATGHHIHEDERRDWEGERERVENQPPSKRIRVEGGSTTSTVAVLGIP
ncbi:GTP binding protein [Russula earlei]|uniref:GTP binding protein n=1 Tax=Russula earlei TaxID=71964 RepID=A0ACC0U1U8_9AGAM|nr:GTP binding protein [Russula earlei]